MNHMNIQQLAVEIERQKNAKRDFVVDTREVSVLSQQDENTKRLRMMIELGTYGEQFQMNNNMHHQVMGKLKIPAAYYNRLLQSHPTLLEGNINYLFKNEHDKNLVRTLDGTARAFLSDRYRRVDNEVIAEAVLPVLGERNDVRIRSCNLTDNKMYIKASFTSLKVEPRVGDVCEAGIIIQNSEVGKGAYSVMPYIYRLACKNGMVSSAYGHKGYHVGRRSDEGEYSYELYADETKKADDKALIMKMRDIAKGAMDEATFELISRKLIESTEGERIKKPIEAVETMVKELGHATLFAEDVRSGILTHLIEGGDLSRWGMANAITRTAQDVDSYDHSTDLERMGGMLIELPKQSWERIAKAA